MGAATEDGGVVCESGAGWYQRFVRAIFNYSGEKNNWRTGEQFLLSRGKNYGLAHKRIYSAATQKTVGTGIVLLRTKGGKGPLGNRAPEGGPHLESV